MGCLPPGNAGKWLVQNETIIYLAYMQPINGFYHSVRLCELPETRVAMIVVCRRLTAIVRTVIAPSNGEAQLEAL